MSSTSRLIDLQGTVLYLGNKGETGCTIPVHTELFGFGAGSWAQGKDAEDTCRRAFNRGEVGLRFFVFSDCIHMTHPEVVPPSPFVLCLLFLSLSATPMRRQHGRPGT